MNSVETKQEIFFKLPFCQIVILRKKSVNTDTIGNDKELQRPVDNEAAFAVTGSSLIANGSGARR